MKMKERCLHDYDETVVEKASWECYNDGYNARTKEEIKRKNE